MRAVIFRISYVQILHSESIQFVISQTHKAIEFSGSYFTTYNMFFLQHRFLGKSEMQFSFDWDVLKTGYLQADCNTHV